MYSMYYPIVCFVWWCLRVCDNHREWRPFANESLKCGVSNTKIQVVVFWERESHFDFEFFFCVLNKKSALSWYWHTHNSSILLRKPRRHRLTWHDTTSRQRNATQCDANPRHHFLWDRLSSTSTIKIAMRNPVDWSWFNLGKTCETRGVCRAPAGNEHETK